MPPAKRDCGVILFDVNSSNKKNLLLALLKIYAYKWLGGTKDTYRLILSNTKKSRNIKGYKNIFDTNITSPNAELILNHIENTENEEGSWLDAILLAIDHLKEEFEKPGVITFQILYITRLDGSQDVNENKVKKIIRELTEYGIYLYIIGPDVKLPYTLTSVYDILESKKQIKVDESIQTLSVAKRIITETKNSIMCDLKTGIHLFHSFKNPHGSQPWKVPLSFGNILEIPTCTVKHYKRDVPFKLSQETMNYHHILQENETVKVEDNQLVSGIAKYGKFVKIDQNDMFKVEGPRSFSVLGFTDKSNIPEYYMRGEGTFYLLPDPEKTKDCCQAFYNLVDILTEENKYAVVRRVYNANNKPKYFVLVPQPKLKPKCFVMSELPYADDVKQNYSFRKPKSGGEDDDAFKNFCNSLDICNLASCKLNIPLSPKLTLDPYLDRLSTNAFKKYLNRDFDFDELDINMEESGNNEFSDAIKESVPEIV